MTEAIKIVALVGGMSIEKQLRLLKQKPAIIVATPGRIWELMSEQRVDYLLKSLPMVDVLVLDEADRMIADGHFKEMQDILAHIYSERVKMKLGKKKQQEDTSVQQATLADMKKAKKSDFVVGKNLEMKKVDIDWSKVQDLYNEDELLGEIDVEELVIEETKGEQKDEKKKRLSQKVIDKVHDEEFTKDYLRAGGI